MNSHASKEVKISILVRSFLFFVLFCFNNLWNTSPQCFWAENPSQDLPCSQEDRFQCEMCHLGHFEISVLNLWVRVCVWLTETFEVSFWEWYADPTPVLFKQLLFPKSLGVSWKHQLWNGTGPHLSLDSFIRALCDLEGAFQRSSWDTKARSLP